MELLTVGIVIGDKQLMDEAQAALYPLPVRTIFEQREVGEWSQFLERLDQTRPDVLLVELERLADPLEEVVKQIKSTAGFPTVIVVHTSDESEKILRAIRASADEYLFPPFKEDLAQAIHRISAKRTSQKAGTRPRGKVFGFTSAKGGCGATTVACHLAVELSAQTKLEVLLADFDIDAGIIGFLMKSQCRYSVLDAVDNINRLDLSFWKALVSNGIPGVEVIMAPSSPSLQQERRNDDFRHVLRFLRSSYDFTLADMGRSLSQNSFHMLEELDELFLVTTLDIPALHQAKVLVRTLTDVGFNPTHIKLVLNRMPRRSEISSNEVQQMIGVPVFTTIGDDFQTLFDAYADKQLAPAKSNLGRDIASLASKISGVNPQKKARGRFFSLATMLD